MTQINTSRGNMGIWSSNSPYGAKAQGFRKDLNQMSISSPVKVQYFWWGGEMESFCPNKTLEEGCYNSIEMSSFWENCVKRNTYLREVLQRKEIFRTESEGRVRGHF
jgi:hypothetical protein